ncbi:hypothetical protein [Calidifontibacillus erzurumensis]|uniref:hypothetical protein n=1 Tax=Calidifontibacillus erzurumensis TaxID=2741433 RepID=UPI0035B56038
MTTFDSKYFFNLIWDRWDEGLNQLYNSQKQIENLFLQTFNQQKNSWELNFKLIESYSKELKSLIEKYQSKVFAALENYQQEDKKNESLQNIQKQLENLIERISELSLTPQNAIKQIMSQNLAHIEKNIEELIEQQQKNRAEMKAMISEVSQEMKKVVEKITEELTKFQNENLSLLK